VVTFKRNNSGQFKYTNDVLIALLNVSPVGELPEGYTSVLDSKEHHSSRLKRLQDERDSHWARAKASNEKRHNDKPTIILGHIPEQTRVTPEMVTHALKQASALIDKWASKNIMFLCIKGTYSPKIFAHLQAKFKKYMADNQRGGFLDFLDSEGETELLRHAQEVPMRQAEETRSLQKKRDGPYILDPNGNAFIERDLDMVADLKNTSLLHQP
jgi:hypothetical protein